MTPTGCLTPDCTAPHDARGYCKRHLTAAYKSGAVTPRPRESHRDRLLRRREITPNGCWEWTGARCPKGYGYTSADGANWRVHRLSYSIFVGPIPNDHAVMHACDNPPCFNPDHLATGTTADNIHDMVNKGRAVFHGLTPQQPVPVPEEIARAIVRDYDAGRGTFKQVGALHGLSESAAHSHYHRIKRATT